MDGIAITITRLPGDGPGADAEMLATATLVTIASTEGQRGGHGVHIATSASPTQPAWERRGFIAGDEPEDIWRLVEKAANWAASEAEKLA